MWWVWGDTLTIKEAISWHEWPDLTPGKLGTVLMGWMYGKVILDIFVCCLQVGRTHFFLMITFSFFIS